MRVSFPYNDPEEHHPELRTGPGNSKDILDYGKINRKFRMTYALVQRKHGGAVFVPDACDVILRALQG